MCQFYAANGNNSRKKKMNGEKMTPFYQPYFCVGCFTVRTCTRMSEWVRETRTFKKFIYIRFSWTVVSNFISCSSFYHTTHTHTQSPRLNVSNTCLRRPNSFFFFSLSFAFLFFSRSSVKRSKSCWRRRRKKWKIKSKWNCTVQKANKWRRVTCNCTLLKEFPLCFPSAECVQMGFATAHRENERQRRRERNVNNINICMNNANEDFWLKLFN